MPPSRKQDEHLLECLRLRDEGLTATEIARRLGRTGEAVRATLKRFDAAATS